MDTPTLLPDLLHYTCSRCQRIWHAVLTEAYGACDDDCGECGARHMTPVVVDTTALTQAAPALILACQTLTAVWDAGEETSSVRWEDIELAVNRAQQALALVQPA